MDRCHYCSLHCHADLSNDLDSCSLRQKNLRRASETRESSRTLNGRPVEIEGSISIAGQWLASATKVLVTGAISGLHSARAAIAVAKQTNAIVDLFASQPVFDWLLSLQNSGASLTTINEARYRSDCITIIAADEVLQNYPRILEQLRSEVISPRQLILIGEVTAPVANEISKKALSLGWSDPQWLHVPRKDLMKFIKSAASARTSEEDDDLSKLAGGFRSSLQDAVYPVIVFSTAVSILGGPMFYSALIDWCFALSIKQRATLLPLSSAGSMLTQACTWLTGFPGRIQMRDGQAVYDPWLYTAEKFQEVETQNSLMIVIDDQSVDSSVRLIAKQAKASPQELRIPVCRAGVECSETMMKADGSTMVYQKTEPSPLPTVAEVLRELPQAFAK